MKKFSEFGIAPTINSLVGDKIKIERILNREITVTDFRIEDSKYGDAGSKCLYIQFNMGGQQHVVFTGSKPLIETIQLVPKSSFPFVTTIIKVDQRYEFS